jgi:hypothetical protein
MVSKVSTTPASLVIKNPTAVVLLTTPAALRMLSPFLSGTHTLTTAAAALDRPPSSVAYWLPRFVAAGLLVELDPQERAGVAMRRYRAAARQFVVPYDLLPVDARVQLLDQGRLRFLRRFFDGLDERLERERGAALGFSAHPERGIAVELMEDEQQRAGRAYTDGWQVLRLSDADARAMARELEDLLERYAARASGRTVYLAHLGLVQQPRHRWRSAGEPPIT